MLRFHLSNFTTSKHFMSGFVLNLFVKRVVRLVIVFCFVLSFMIITDAINLQAQDNEKSHITTTGSLVRIAQEKGADEIIREGKIYKHDILKQDPPGVRPDLVELASKEVKPSEAVLTEWKKFKAKYPTATIAWDPNTGLPRRIDDFQTEAIAGTPKEVAESFIKEYQVLLGIELSDFGVSEITTHKNDKGQSATYVRYQQVYNGITIEKTSINLRMEENKITHIDLSYYRDIKVDDIEPTIAREEAIDFIRKDLGIISIKSTKDPTISLVLYEPLSDQQSSKNLYLSWKVNILLPKENADKRYVENAWIYVIDAKTGKILFKRNYNPASADLFTY